MWHKSATVCEVIWRLFCLLISGIFVKFKSGALGGSWQALWLPIRGCTSDSRKLMWVGWLCKNGRKVARWAGLRGLVDSSSAATSLMTCSKSEILKAKTKQMPVVMLKAWYGVFLFFFLHQG